MLSGLSLGDHLNKAANNQPPYNKHHTTLESVTDTEPTILEEEDEQSLKSLELGGNASFDESFAAVSLDGDTSSLPSLQAAPPMSNNSIRSARSTRSNASNTTTRSSGNRSTRQVRVQQQHQQQHADALPGGQASCSNMMMAPKSTFSSLRRSNTGHARTHSPARPAFHRTNSSDRHVPFRRELGSNGARSVGRVRESSERSPEQPKRRNREKMRRTQSLNNREHNNEEPDSRITRFMNRTREPPQRDFLQREPSLKFSNHSRLGTVSGHNMHSSFMFSGDALEDLDGSYHPNEGSGMMDRIGESNESDDAGDMQDLSIANLDDRRRRSSNKPKPKEDAKRMASLLRFGSAFFGSKEELEEEQEKDALREVDTLPVYWTRNAENMPHNGPELNYLPSARSSSPRSTVGVMKEIAHDSTFAQNINFLQDHAEAQAQSWAKDVNTMVEEKKTYVEERLDLWQRNMSIIGAWIKEASS